MYRDAFFKTYEILNHNLYFMVIKSLLWSSMCNLDCRSCLKTPILVHCGRNRRDSGGYVAVYLTVFF